MGYSTERMSTRPALHIVTGAFGFTGRRIAERLISGTLRVRTLTNRPAEAGAFGTQIETAPLDFSRPDELTESLRGAEVLYNTYWVRFSHGAQTHNRAVENTRTLIKAAAAARIRRVVHISITHPHEDSPFSYFRCKAQMERIVRESGLSYAILRPTVLFGRGDILLNNIAWMLRRLPVFGVFGDGSYKVQPVFVDDLADLAVSCSAGNENLALDAVGPEVFAYEELVESIRRAVGSHCRVLHLSPRLALVIGKAMGWVLGDVVITQEEIGGLMAGLLVSDAPATCPTRLSDWLSANHDELGRCYASELRRHFARPPQAT